MLHYNPRHVSSINMPIFRRTNCIITVSGIVTLCAVQCSMTDESRLYRVCCHPAYCTAHLQEDKLYYHSIWYRHSVYSTVQYAGWELYRVCFHPVYCTAHLQEDKLYYHSIWYRHCIQYSTVCRMRTLQSLLSSGILYSPSSGGQIVLSQHLASSLSVQYSKVCRMTTDSVESALIRHTVQLIFRRTNSIITASGIVTVCTAVYREWRYQILL
jgi:hypothetical protein